MGSSPIHILYKYSQISIYIIIFVFTSSFHRLTSTPSSVLTSGEPAVHFASAAQRSVVLVKKRFPPLNKICLALCITNSDIKTFYTGNRERFSYAWYNKPGYIYARIKTSADNSRLPCCENDVCIWSELSTVCSFVCIPRLILNFHSSWAFVFFYIGLWYWKVERKCRMR